MTNQKTEEIFHKELGFSLIGNNESITLTKNDIFRVMEYHHKYLLEEAGKELPDKDVVSKYADVNSNNFPDQGSGKMCNAAQYEGIIDGAEWMKEKASALLAIKQREIEGLKDKIANWVVQMKAPVVPLPIKQEDIDKCLKDKEEANITLLTNELKKFQSSFISQENVEKMVDFYYFMNTAKEAHQAQRKMMSPQMGNQHEKHNRKIVLDLCKQFCSYNPSLADNKEGEVLDTRKKISGHERGFLIDNPNCGGV